MNKGYRLAIKKSDYEKALICFEKAYRLDTTNLEALVNKAAALNDLEREDEALRTLFSARTKGYASSNIWYYNVGITYYAKDDYRSAIFYLDSAIIMDNKDADSYLYKAFSYEELNLKDSAMINYQKSFISKPEDFDTNKYYGIILFKLDHFTEAKKLLLTADQKYSKDFEVQMTLYKIYKKENNKEQACRHFRLAKKLDDENMLAAGDGTECNSD